MTIAHARATAGFKTDLYNQTAFPDKIPDDIQWMPPGQNIIRPFIEGSPVEITIDVDADLAAKMNAQLQQLRKDAANGNGDVPFIDFNHEDAEAAGEVTELYWGGNDPVKGGIRAKVKWSSAGKAALAGNTYRRFSPQWFLDEKTHEPIGVGVNLGGLVNRAAFKNIARVMAKDGSDALASNAGLVQALGKDGAARFSKILNQQLAAACDKIDEIEDLGAKLEANAAVGQARSAAIVAGATHPFLVQARAMAAEKKITESQAQQALAQSNYGLYRDYMTALQAHAAAKRQVRTIQTPGSEFVSAVNTLQAQGKSFEDACSKVCASRPELYQSYRRSVVRGLK